MPAMPHILRRLCLSRSREVAYACGVRTLRDVCARLATVGEILAFFATNKRWWLLPMVVVLLVISLLAIALQATAVGPFLYPLF